MKKLILLSLLILGSWLFIFPVKVQAVSKTGDCTWTVKDKNGAGPPFDKSGILQTSLNWTIGNLVTGGRYKIYTQCDADFCPGSTTLTATENTSTRNGEVKGKSLFTTSSPNGNITILIDDLQSVQPPPKCTYTISPSEWISEPTPTPALRADCSLSLIQGTDLKLKASIYNVKGMTGYNVACRAGAATLCSGSVTGPISKTFSITDFNVNNASGPKIPKSATLNMGRDWPDGNYSVNINVGVISTTYPIKYLKVDCSNNFNIPDGIITPYPMPSGTDPYPSLAPLCDQLPGEFQVDCRNCVERQGKIWTAIGCISPDAGEFVSEQLLGFGVGIGGAIAFLYFLYGAFLFLTSKGNPEQIGMGREIIISSLLGLALIIFSVFLLRVIAVDILDLKPFGFG